MTNPQLRFKKNNKQNYSDWKQASFREVMDIIKSGGTPSSKNPAFYDGQIPFLGISDITKNGKFITSTEKRISEEGLKNCSAWLVPENSLILAMYASYGKTCINKCALATSQALLTMIPKRSHCLEFLYQYCVHLNNVGFWDSHIKSGTQPNLSKETVASSTIHIPENEEQGRIGSFFSLLDDKINLAERTLGLIENTRKATTDQIFKRQLCLTKTDGSLYEHWQEHTFSSIFTFLRTKPIPRAHLNGHNSPYNIHYGDILTKYDTTIDLQTDELPSISDDINMSNTDVLKEGDLIIADTAEDSSAGKAIEILNTSNQTIYAGLHTFACRPNTKFAPGFLGYYLNSSTYHNQLLRLMTGTKVLSISKAQISTTKILIPTLAEQERITTLLNNLREKTRIQRKKLCALKALKNALLQQMFV
ncbi:MAG: restriction endonuclease subunit S [Sutterella sp.]|nr:restriction endonuclease subunit S [Sutterella sp.]